MIMKDKLTKEEQQFVENTLHRLEYERGMYMPLTDQELRELSPELREAVLIARDRAMVTGYDE